eukprot:gene1792-2415_t
MGYEPRVAMLAYSTFGHPQGERSERVQEAVRILDKRRVDFEYDGEMAADVALNARAMAQYPFIRLTGPANVLIMPGLQSANISAKLLRELGGDAVIGPMLVGMEKPVQIAPMTSTAGELGVSRGSISNPPRHGAPGWIAPGNPRSCWEQDRPGAGDREAVEGACRRRSGPPLLKKKIFSRGGAEARRVLRAGGRRANPSRRARCTVKVLVRGTLAALATAPLCDRSACIQHRRANIASMLDYLSAHATLILLVAIAVLVVAMLQRVPIVGRFVSFAIMVASLGFVVLLVGQRARFDPAFARIAQTFHIGLLGGVAREGRHRRVGSGESERR